MKQGLLIVCLGLVACNAGPSRLEESAASAPLKTNQPPPLPDCNTSFNPQAPTGPGYFDLDPINMNRDTLNDIAVYRPSSRYWYWQNPNTQLSGLIWGLAGDFMMPQDFNGDGLTDPAVFRPSEGRWYILESKNTWQTYYTNDLGEPGDEPVAADYDGDCRADLAVWTPTTGQWIVQPSNPESSKPLEYKLGEQGDTPVMDDYDGDLKADPAVYQDGSWTIIGSKTGEQRQYFLGAKGEIPVPFNYDGDLEGVDLATFNPETGVWRIQPSSGRAYRLKFGAAGDIPAPGFYSGKTPRYPGVPAADLAVFRDGTWFILGAHPNIPYCTPGSLDGLEATVCHFGLPGDIPIHRQVIPESIVR
jgi:FG-GAP-like repeat